MAKPTHWDRPDNPRKRSMKQEKRIAGDLGMKTTPNSGATPFQKSDASDEVFRAELKTTRNKTFPITLTELEKIWREAVATGLLPCVVVTMESMPEPITKDWVLIEKSTFEALRGDDDLR